MSLELESFEPMAGTLRRLRERALPVNGVLPECIELTRRELEAAKLENAGNDPFRQLGAVVGNDPKELFGLPVKVVPDDQPVARAHVSPRMTATEVLSLQTPPMGLESPQTGLFAPESTEGVNVCILALDLGTKTGYAVRRRDGRIVHGTQSFASRASWSPGQRWSRFRAWLGELLDQHQVHRIAYEHVSFHAGVRDAHCYGAFRALVEMAADARRLELVGTNVQTIKRHWTGKGGADKAGMIAEARRRGFRPETDNDADALAVLDWAVAQERAA